MTQKSFLIFWLFFGQRGIRSSLFSADLRRIFLFSIKVHAFQFITFGLFSFDRSDLLMLFNLAIKYATDESALFYLSKESSHMNDNFS